MAIPAKLKAVIKATFPAARMQAEVNSLTTKVTRLREQLEAKSAIISRLEGTREDLLGRNAALAEDIVELRRKYRLARTDQRDVSPTQHNTSDAMDAFFAQDEAVDAYTRFAVALHKLLDEKGVTMANKSVLDVGVGPGLMLQELLKDQTPAHITGLDFSSVAIEKSRAHMPEGDFQIASVYDPIAARGDVVLCTEVLEHLQHPERALGNILDAITPGGVAVLTVPDGRVDFSNYHINFWSPESWACFIEDCAQGRRFETGQFRVTESSAYKNNFALIHG